MNQNTLSSEFVRAYNSGKRCKISFFKKNGDLRQMVCQRQDEMEAAITGEGHSARPGMKHVCEITAENELQWRCVTLDRLQSFEVID